MKNKNENKFLGHPLATGALANTVRLLWKNGGIDGRYGLRALNILLSNLLLIPFQMVEHHKWADKIDEIQIQEPPLFIIGTWRSGTTYLQSLLTQDGNMGFVSTLQAFCPDICIEGSKILGPIFKKLLPKKRPMDNMLMALEYPQEEEYAMGNLSPYSFYIGYSLPRSMSSLFDLLSFKDNNEDVKNAWKHVYLRVLKKATLIMDGKRLVLKNPLNTSRIPVLLEMFPAAKFIFLYRNPYIIYSSLLNTFSRLIGAFQLERISKPEIEEYVFTLYEKMMRMYGTTKEFIPSGNLVEVRFEDFENNALAVVDRIYKELNLPGFDNTKDKFEKYIVSQAGYEKNHYALSQATVDRISRSWRFAIEEYHYSPPGDICKS